MVWRIFRNNKRFTGGKNIKYNIDDILIDTGTDYFRAVVGNDCAVDASVTILPGTQILPTSKVQARTAIGKD